MPDLIWLRAAWLWGLIPFFVLCFFVWRGRRHTAEWDDLVDPELRPYVLESDSRSSDSLRIFSLLFCLLGLLVLAGPVWEQQPRPAFKQQKAQLILFDLSSSMLTDDLKPSRLVRARYKLLDLMQRADGVQMGLIAFSERPYVVSPLSDDAATLSAFVESLSPDVMPVIGSRADLAVLEGVSLLQQAGATGGQIVLITDTAVDAKLRQAVTQADAAGYSVSILAAGTTAGAPLRSAAGQFVKDKNGAIVVPRIDFQGYQDLVATASGVAVMLSDTNADLDALQNALSGQTAQSSSDAAENDAVTWVEYGPYLLPILMLILLPYFRRGATS